MIEIAGQHLRQARGQLEGGRVAHLEGRRVIHPADLGGDRLRDLLAAMAGVDAPQAGGGIEHLAAVMGGVVHVLGGDEEPRLALELPVGRERHPEGFEVVRGGVEGRAVRRCHGAVLAQRKAAAPYHDQEAKRNESQLGPVFRRKPSAADAGA
jgi:hypothetical protein